MAAYGAAISLKNAIQHILQSSRISLVSPSPQILQPVYDELLRLQSVLLKLDETGYSKIRAKVNALDELIKEAVWEFEDLLESQLSHQTLPQIERDHLLLSVDLQSLRHHADCFIEMVKMMEEEYTDEMENMPEEEGEPVSSRIDFGGIKSKMVGFSDHFKKARDYLMEENTEKYCYSLIGMPGVGKTTLAKQIFEDPSIRSHFEFRGWVKVGRKCESSEILRSVLAQLDPNTYKMLNQGEDDDELVELLKVRLKGEKCLIVLDDVWDEKVTCHFINSLVDKNDVGMIRFLLTSRQRIMYEMFGYERVRFLNEEESKELLGQKVFGDESFPPELEELGEKIAQNCDGLPLMIVTVADLLSKAEKTPEYWKQVIAKQRSSLFMDAYNQISEVFFPSYDYLPQFFKMLFIYLGAYPRKYSIYRYELVHLLSAEGFLESIGEQTFEDFLYECLARLRQVYHLVLYHPMGSGSSYEVHSCWQHLCREEASKIKFLHVLRGCDDVIKDQRRLCAHGNSLLCFKQVCDSIKSDCASTVRSLLCFGPYHRYPVPLHAMAFELLKVLEAYPVRFYSFPIEILKLVCLQYLSLTCNGEVPTSINNLFHLQFLIICQYICIKKRGAQSYLPVQIWDMQELTHIRIAGRDLPTPNSDATLNKLIALSGVSANSCRREVLQKIPNIKTLVILEELKPYDDDDDDSNPLNSLGYISELYNLELLGYYITNPEMKHELTATPLIPLSMFPSSLKILHLSGLAYSWKFLNDIGSLLPNLETLNLECYAFQGTEWDIESGLFLKLRTLIIEDTNLVRWRPQRGSFQELRYLTMKHCYKLQQLDWPYDHSCIVKIELVECNPLAVAFAKQLNEKIPFELYIDSTI